MQTNKPTQAKSAANNQRPKKYKTNKNGKRQVSSYDVVLVCSHLTEIHYIVFKDTWSHEYKRKHSYVKKLQDKTKHEKNK